VSNPNELNTAKGRQFQHRCAEALKAHFGQDFHLEIPLLAPGEKPHKFDLASADRSVVAECKAFCWTRPDFGIPVAKITTLKEAIQYLRGISGPQKRILIIQRDVRHRTGETLASYFVRLNQDLIGDVVVMEMPLEGGELTCIWGELSPK